MNKILRIGTRDSQLAVWQATLVQEQLQQQGIAAELVYMKSDGDIDLVTPLYEIGVQGIFTKTLDAALLSNRIDIAVHSMKDVPTVLAKGIQQAAVLKRASYKDILVTRDAPGLISEALGWIDGQWIANPENHPVVNDTSLTIATSSIRRKAQWLNRYPGHRFDNLRGNVNTRLRKVAESNWHGAIFAAAGVERIGLRPVNSIELDWMLPAPAQGAIMVVCRTDDENAYRCCSLLNDPRTALCTQVERDFLKTLLGGCATPISALAEWNDENIVFRGNILSVDGKEKLETSYTKPASQSGDLGMMAAVELLNKGADHIVKAIRNA